MNPHTYFPISRFSYFLPFALLVSISLTSCNGCGKKEDNWHKLPKAEFGIPPYARYLEGVKICLDPGHGGQGHLPNYKRGPKGLREAEVNLRVALDLQDFLAQAGAIVAMTRTNDSFVSLAERSEIANQNEVDFFISLHHNSMDNANTNYTSTWYHRDADDSPTSLDLARYIQQGVADALRLPQVPSTGLYSDQLVVPSGFGVLRLTKPPAVVCEASFYSNPAEEKRLREKSYNRREAYGYLLGIARYVAAGFPKGVLRKPLPESIIETKTPRIEIRVTDGLHARGAWMIKRQQVFSNSIRVKLDDVVIPHQYLRGRDLIVVTPTEPLFNGVHLIETNLVNYYGNHSLPVAQWFKVAPPAAQIKLSGWAEIIPPDGESYVGITVAAYDVDGQSIADDETIHARTSLGRLADAVQMSKNGIARFYLHTDTTTSQSGTAQVKVSYRDKQETIAIRFAEIQGGIVQGNIRDTAGNSLADTAVQLIKENHRTTTTDPSGHFFFNDTSPGQATMVLSKAGYYILKLQAEVAANRARVIHPKLHPIADGALIGQVFVLDARYGGGERGTPAGAANLNLAVVKALKQILEIAGAKVYLIREEDRKIPVLKRVGAVNAIKQDGYYLRIDHNVWVKGEPSVIGAHYPGNQVAENFVKAILQHLNLGSVETPIETVQDLKSPEIRSTNKVALALEIRSINHPELPGLIKTADSPAWVVREAYAIFLGTYQFLWQRGLPHTRLEVQVVDRASTEPLTGAKVDLDGTLRLVTGRDGRVAFRGIRPREYRLVIGAEGYIAQEIIADLANQERFIIELGQASAPSR